MNKIFQRIFELKKEIKKTGEIFKGSLKDPLFCLWIISIVLFNLISLSSGIILKSFPNQGDFSFLLVSKDLEETFNQDLFIGQIKKFLPESSDFLLVQKNSLVKTSPPVMINFQVLGVLIEDKPYLENREEIIEYLVEEGDNLWSVAEKFEISVDTLISANNLKNQLIRPGQELLILPVSGVMHIVKKGESISDLAEKYKIDAEKITAFNRLLEEDRISIGQRLIIPGGKIPLVRSTIARTNNSNPLSTNNFYGQSHAFPFGQCTWWVAQRRTIPAWGHAKSWLSNAAADGYQICRGRHCVPKKGAVIVVEGHPVFGHVGYVEKVQGNQVTFSEMNNSDLGGFGKMNYRTVTIGSSSIIGYIY